MKVTIVTPFHGLQEKVAGRKRFFSVLPKKKLNGSYASKPHFYILCDYEKSDHII
jgi:hypothetical protein